MTKHVRILAASSPQDDGVPYLFDKFTRIDPLHF